MEQITNTARAMRRWSGRQTVQAAETVSRAPCATAQVEKALRTPSHGEHVQSALTQPGSVVHAVARPNMARLIAPQARRDTVPKTTWAPGGRRNRSGQR